MFRLLSLFSLMFPGLCRSKWEVKYLTNQKCALKGSTVLLSGTYQNQRELDANKIFWIVNPSPGNALNLMEHPSYQGRVEFFEKNQSLSLRLSNVSREDDGMYCIRILAKKPSQSHMQYPGIVLNVTELRVELPDEPLEGSSAALTCKSSCNLPNTTNFIWSKNQKLLSESQGSNHLSLSPITREDAGNYSCASTEPKHLQSASVALSVRYPPKNILVSISGSPEVTDGHSVTLICSTDSNPPPHTYTWFKEALEQENISLIVGSGQSLIISSFNSSHSGRYSCEAQNKYGSQISASIFLTSAGGQQTALQAAVGFGVAVIFIFIIIVVVIITRRTTRDPGEQYNCPYVSVTQANKSAPVLDQMSVRDLIPYAQNDGIYASVHKEPRKHDRSGEDDEVQYATVHFIRNPDKQVMDQGSAESARSDDFCVIYSSISIP
ncbi:hypothetical protein DNTS_030191 [Danionella cerebrum]|uniref:Ig-like domain-containing protein n=1 Tax=Danionella cerebrum TaxID=2873325 RepID=A0A553Q850_9TELE|nr:hypothetical protein DNTS_030191 [Danionella translucida]